MFGMYRVCVESVCVLGVTLGKIVNDIYERDMTSRVS